MSDTMTRTEPGPTEFHKRRTRYPAWQVTKENKEAIALWCSGAIHPFLMGVAEEDGVGYMLTVPTRDGPEEARVGSWVVVTETGIKVIPNYLFSIDFEEASS